MNFKEIAEFRQSCRKYDNSKMIEKEKIDAILSCARLAPSACNSQPYKITVCSGKSAKMVAAETQSMGMNKFTDDAPVMLVISEGNYVASAAFGAKLKNNDYRSIDIGILSAYITAEAAAQGLGSCILGWFNDKKIREICSLQTPIRLVIALGYPAADDKIRLKKRKDLNSFVSFIE